MGVEQGPDRFIPFLTGSSTYIVSKHQAYDGCVQVKFGTPDGPIILYGPPWEFAQHNPDDVIDEILRLQMSLYEGARYDRSGRLFIKRLVRFRSEVKTVINGVPTVQDFIDQIRNQGYDINAHYFDKPTNKDRIRDIRYTYRR
ncbi:hypothetical protein HY357_04135 [Candidatus Roizmanbacteria bacterium]|nr:hypothetical protein [Candidatus Roizmanbacteria bacterium]